MTPININRFYEKGHDDPESPTRDDLVTINYCAKSSQLS